MAIYVVLLRLPQIPKLFRTRLDTGRTALINCDLLVVLLLTAFCKYRTLLDEEFFFRIDVTHAHFVDWCPKVAKWFTKVNQRKRNGHVVHHLCSVVNTNWVNVSLLIYSINRKANAHSGKNANKKWKYANNV